MFFAIRIRFAETTTVKKFLTFEIGQIDHNMVDLGPFFREALHSGIGLKSQNMIIFQNNSIIPLGCEIRIIIRVTKC